MKPRCQHRPSVLYLLQDFCTFPEINVGSGLAPTSCFWENLFHVLSLSSPIQVPCSLSDAELTLYTSPSLWITWKNYPCGTLMCNSLYCTCENAEGCFCPSRANILNGKQKKWNKAILSHHGVAFLLSFCPLLFVFSLSLKKVWLMNVCLVCAKSLLLCMGFLWLWRAGATLQL